MDYLPPSYKQAYQPMPTQTMQQEQERLIQQTMDLVHKQELIENMAREHHVIGEIYLGLWQTLARLTVGIAICATVWLVGASLAHAGDNSATDHNRVNISLIAQIESSGNPQAHNVREDARGLCQIRPGVLHDYNRAHKTTYRMSALWEEDVNRYVCDWYINAKIPMMLSQYGLSDNVKNRILAYNWGIRNVRKYYGRQLRVPDSTRRYLVKYNALLTKGKL